jgi:hypothetical protein
MSVRHYRALKFISTGATLLAVAACGTGTAAASHICSGDGDLAS